MEPAFIVTIKLWLQWEEAAISKEAQRRKKSIYEMSAHCLWKGLKMRK